MENPEPQEVLTESRQTVRIADMDNETSIDQRPRRKYSELAAKPIMIYPQSAEQRALFEEAARADNRKLSPFIVHVVAEYLQQRKSAETPEGRLEEARKRMMQRTA